MQFGCDKRVKANVFKNIFILLLSYFFFHLENKQSQTSKSFFTVAIDYKFKFIVKRDIDLPISIFSDGDLNDLVRHNFFLNYLLLV